MTVTIIIHNKNKMSYDQGQAQLKINEIQLKHIMHRLFDVIDVKGRNALDREEFREMLIFCIDDIFSNKEHHYGEDEKDQNPFNAVWDPLTKIKIPVRKENAVNEELTHP